MDEKELQKKYMEYQMIDEKVKELQKQLQTTEQQILEISATLQSLDEFSNLNDKCEILVPVNNGIFAKAHLKKDDKLLINIGASIVVDKTIPQAKELIESQRENINSIRQQINGHIQTLASRASVLEKDLSAAVK